MARQVGFKGVFDEKQVMSALRNMESGIGKVNDEFDELGKHQKSVFTKMKTGIDRNNKAIKDNTKSFSQFGSTFKGVFASNIALGAITAITQGLKNMATGAVQAAAGYETTQISFETFLGSAEKARDVMADLEKFSLETPFSPDQVNNAGKALLAFGIEQEKLIPTLKAVGDLSAGTGKDFNELAVIYGKARTQGTLFAEDINQLTEAGIPIIQEFAKQFGVAEGQVKKLGSEGKITFANLEQAFKDMTGEGGKFFELTAKQSKSFSGLMSTAQGAFRSILREAGNVFLPIAKQILPPVINGMFALIDAMRPVVTIVKRTVGPIFTALRNTVSPLSKAFGSFADRMKAFASNNEALSRFATTTAQIAKGVGSLVSGLFKVIKTIAQVGQKLNPLRLAFKGTGTTIQSVAGFFGGLGEVISAMVNNAKVNVNRFVTDIEILAAKAKKFGREITSLGRADTSAEDQLIKDLQQKRADIEAGFISLIQAYKNGRDEVLNTSIVIPPEKEKEIVQQFGDLGKKTVEEMTKGMKDALKDYDKILDDIADKVQAADLASKTGKDLINAQAEIELAQIQALENTLRETAKKAGKAITDEEIKQLEILRKAVEKKRQEQLKAYSKQRKEEAEQLNSGRLQEQLAYLDTEKTLQEAQVNNTIEKEEEKQKALLELDRQYLQQKLLFLTQSGAIDEKQAQIILEQIKAIDNQLSKLGSSGSAFDKLKEAIRGRIKEALNIDDQELAALEQTLSFAFETIASAWTQNVDFQIEENSRLLESIRERIAETESLLEDELARQEKGYANNVEAKRKELKDLKAEEDKAEKERVKLRKQQLKARLASDATAQLSGLATMASNILAHAGKLGPILGPILAAAGILAMTQIFKNYKAEAKALTSERAFTGGPVDQFLAGRSDRQGGRGHRVEDSNLIIGGDEYIVRGSTTAKNRPFLDGFNRGDYDHIDLNEMLAPYKKTKVRPMIMSGQYAARIKKRDLFNAAGMTKEDMREIMMSHVQEVREIIEEQPFYYTMDEDTKAVIKLSKGRQTRINVS